MCELALNMEFNTRMRTTLACPVEPTVETRSHKLLALQHHARGCSAWMRERLKGALRDAMQAQGCEECTQTVKALQKVSQRWRASAKCLDTAMDLVF